MNPFKKNKNSKTNSLKLEGFSKIQRTKTVEGRFIPGIIENGSHFYTKIEVYADGLVDAWGLLDLELFKQKLEQEWVVTHVPDGESLRFHHLGQWKVKKGTWLFDEHSYYDHVVSILKDMNPNMRNLHNCFGETTEMVGKARKSILGMGGGRPYKLEDETALFPRKKSGQSFYAFVKTGETEFTLANILIFPDSSIQIAFLEKLEKLTLEAFKEQVAQGRVTTNIPEDAVIKLYGLGEFVVGACDYREEIQDKVLEIEDMIAELNGEKTSSDICNELYEEYCKNPTVKLKAALKVAYEKIPDHLRMYVLRDMDLKDIPVRMIIYGDKEMESWSHYAVAKGRGDEELPSITVPKPKDDEEEE